MDIIKKIFNLNHNDLLTKINNIIYESEKMIENILNNQINDQDKIRLLIEDTFLFDTYYGVINIKILLAESNDELKSLIMAETKLKNYNTNFNKNKRLLELIINLIKTTEDQYNKIFLAKMGQSIEKFGTRFDNDDKISKILIQLEQTENNILNTIEKSLSIKLDRKKIDAHSDSIMSTVYNDLNNVQINKKIYYYLLKKISDKKLRNEISDKYIKKFVNILPLVGKLIVLRDAYSKNLGNNNFYELISGKSQDETNNIHELIRDLNTKLDEKFNVILHNLKSTNNYLDKVSINDIIYLLNKFEVDIKIKPIEIMQIVMFTIQKKFNLEFKYSNINSLNKHTNCIEIYDSNKKLRGYLHIDLLARETKNINQITVIKLNNQYKENLPNVYLLGCYSDLEKNSCTYTDMVVMFREFGNVLMNIFAITPNGISELDVEIYNFIPDFMEFLAYDDFVLDLLCNKLYNNDNKGIKKIKNIKIYKSYEIIINLKIKCLYALFDNIIHVSDNLINEIKKCELEDIKIKLLQLYNKIFNDVFQNQKHIINLDFNLITPQIIYNLIDGNQGLIFGSVISYILAFNCYDIMKKSSSNKFIIDLLENKNYSYKQTILNYISDRNIDYYTYFLKNCLDINEEENYYEEETNSHA
jgi:Zn-dependent oligopeptidase